MIFLSDIEGTITAIVPSPIYQGSSNAKELVLIAPFPSTSAVSVSIRLPNGQRLVPQIANPNEFVMSFLSGFEGKLRAPDGRILHAWRLQLDAPVTQYSGNLSVQFLIANGNGVIESTSESVVNIGRGTPYLMPSNVSEWSQILNSIQQYYADMRELIEWDYVITPADIDYSNFINSFQARLYEAKGYVLVKGVVYADAWFVASVSADTKYIKFVNSQITCDIVGNKNCTIDGFSGVSWNNRERASTLVTFGRVINCYQVALLNCLRVSNSTIQCYRYDVSDEPHTVDDVIFINPEGSPFNVPALACVNPVDDIPNGAQSKGNNCTVSNITFINGTVDYRTIMGATAVSEVRRVGDVKISYIGCGYVDGLSCMDYYTAEDDGKAILASADGSKKLKDVYGKDEVYNKTEADEKETALSGRISANSTAISTNSTAITGLNVKVRANELEIQSVKESLTKVYIYKGTVENFSDLPTTGLEIGDVYNVESAYTDPDTGIEYPAGTNFAWDGHGWESIGGDFAAFSQRLSEAESDISALDESVNNLEDSVSVLEEKEEWDYVITSLEDFTTENLATMSGRVLVNIDNIHAEEVVVHSGISVLKFINSNTIIRYLRGTSSTSLIGYSNYVPDAATYDCYISRFGRVENVKATNVDISGCEYVTDSDVWRVKKCTFVNNVKVYGSPYYRNPLFEDCLMVSNVTILDDTYGTDLDGEGELVEFKNCKHISNVHYVTSVEGNKITYENCLFVDGDTCDGYYTDEDNGKVQTVNTDGSKSLISVYDKTEIDTMYGDIETSLDSIIAIQNALIGGTT